MKRELFGMEISQKSKSEFFSATDLVKAGNSWRALNRMQGFDLPAYFKQKSTKEFMEELESKFGCVKIPARGRGQHTWVHPFLFIDIALAISPRLKLEAYSWIFDKLIMYRNDSGDSYKKMCGSLYCITTNKSLFPKTISDVARLIQVECNVSDWQTATQEQLHKRDRIHENIALLAEVLRDISRAVKIGIEKASNSNYATEHAGEK
jgi:hypothetical protein